MWFKLATGCRPPLKTTWFRKNTFCKINKPTKKSTHKLTSDHLQPHVPFDVVEPTWDLYAAAVRAGIFCLHFRNRERHISIGNIALEIVLLWFSECHPIPSGVQNFVIALWIWTRASAPAHIGDVLMLCHLVEARQLNSLPYYSSDNSFGCRVGCQGRTRKGECWQSPMRDSTCATQRGRKRNVPACRIPSVSPPPEPVAANVPGHKGWQPGAGRRWLAAGAGGLHALASAGCWRAAHQIYHSHQTCGEWSRGLSLAAWVQTRPVQMEFGNSAPIPSPLLRDFESCSEPSVKYTWFSQSTIVSFKKEMLS